MIVAFFWGAATTLTVPSDADCASAPPPEVDPAPFSGPPSLVFSLSELPQDG